MSDFREKLQPFLNKRVEVRGVFAKWDDHWVRNFRQVGRVCIADPEIDGQVACEHIWVVDVPHWKQHQDATGMQVAFDAVIKKYTTRSKETNLCMGNASDLSILHLPVLAIPDPLKDDEMVEPLEERGKSAPSSQMERIHLVKTFARTCGGYDQIRKMLTNMPPISISEMLDIIKVLED